MRKLLIALMNVLLITVFFISPVSAENYIQDDFEDKNLTEWYHVPKAKIVNPQNGTVHSGNYSLHIPYDVPAECPEHKDNNRFIQKDFSGENIDHFYVRGYFYLEEPDTEEETVEARKLFYMFSENHASDPYWHIMVSANGGKENVEYPQPLSLSIASQNTDCSDIGIPTWRLAKGDLSYDTWHGLELEVKLNTPGKSDGACRLWVDGNLIFEETEISIRCGDNSLGRARIGAQIDRHGDCLARHSNRYWDDIVISDSYNGLLGEGNTAPNPPENLTINE